MIDFHAAEGLGIVRFFPFDGDADIGNKLLDEQFGRVEQPQILRVFIKGEGNVLPDEVGDRPHVLRAEFVRQIDEHGKFAGEIGGMVRRVCVGRSLHQIPAPREQPIECGCSSHDSSLGREKRRRCALFCTKKVSNRPI